MSSTGGKHNHPVKKGLLKDVRRFIPKEHQIDEYSPQEIFDIEFLSNNLPRKILGYQMPDEIFEEEIDRIHAVWTITMDILCNLLLQFGFLFFYI